MSPLYAYYSKDEDGPFVEMFYRLKEIKYNDGTTGKQLQYRSFAKLWMGTLNKDPDKLMKKLKPITVEEFERITGEKYIEYEHC